MKPILKPIMQRWCYFAASLILALGGLLIPNAIIAQRPCSLTCGGNVNLSVDENCMGQLELAPGFGDQSCPDHGTFQIEFKDASGNVLSNPFDASNYLGQLIGYKVTDPVSGNSCWGNILVEDKWLPPLECSEYEVPCNLPSFAPGTRLRPLVQTTTFLNLSFYGKDIPDGGSLTIPFRFSRNGGFYLEEVVFFLDIEHANVGSLSANLASSLGDNIGLFDRPGNPQGSCDGEDMTVSFHNDGLANSELHSTCNDHPAISGIFKAMSDLEALDNANQWELEIIDHTADGISGSVKQAYIEIRYYYSEDAIPFPVAPGTRVLPTSQARHYRLPNYDNCGDAWLSYTDREEVQPMCGDCVKIIYRDWKLEDEQGNMDVCTDTICVQRAELDDVEDLPNYDDRDRPALRCEHKERTLGPFIPRAGWNAIDPGDLPHDDYVGHPSPYHEYYTFLGFPTNIVKWYGTGTPLPVNHCCTNISYTFKDTRLNHCPAPSSSDGCFKVLREWTILEWCSGRIKRDTQLIKVKDTRAPRIRGLRDVTISTDQYECEVDWEATVPRITDNCSDIEDYTVSASAGAVTYNSATMRWTVHGLPPGMHTITYSVKDCCGNQRIRRIKITVEDQATPNPHCKAIVSQQLTTDGTVRLPATIFDDGSYDACGDVYFKAIRMEDLLGTTHGSYSDQSDTDCDLLNGDDAFPFPLDNQIWFDDYVWFCCEDVGATDLMVVLRIFDAQPPTGPINPFLMRDGVLKDAAGNKIANFVDCMVPVIILDKEAPRITCPDDVELECTDDFDAVLTNDISPNPPGAPVCMGTPSNHGPVIGYYNGVEDNCGETKVYVWDEGSIDACKISLRPDGMPGPIIRHWVAVDESGRFDECTQSINITNPDPFDESDITCPDDFDIFISAGNCNPSIAEEDLNDDQKPKYRNTDCAKILDAPEDKCFNRDDLMPEPDPGICKKILRTWTIRDWCQRDLDPWVCLQAIYIKDTEAPTVNCDIVNQPPIMAMDDVTVEATVTDNCQSIFDDTNVTHEIELEDGTITSGTVTNSASGDGILVNYMFPEGTHTITFTATDSCGLTGTGSCEIEVSGDECDNVRDFVPISLGDILPVRLELSDVYSGSIPGAVIMLQGLGTATFFDFDCSHILYNMKYPTEYTGMVIFPGTGIPPCNFLLTVQDVKGPEAGVCKNISPVLLENVNGVDQATINISQIRSGVETDNCTAHNDLIISFDPLNFAPPINVAAPPSGTDEVTISCADLDANGEYTLVVYVYDLTGQGNDCDVTLRFKNTASTNCAVALPADFNIAGTIQRDDGAAVEDVMVHLSGGMAMDQMTDSEGSFQFDDVPSGYNYSLQPEKDTDPLNGVSTYDLVLMSKHILGVLPLSSPYAMIAADINRSGSITTFDVVELRKMILFINTSFPQNTSWRFIDAAYSFPDPANPFAYSFPEVFNINNLTSSEQTSFVAVKTGDVNGSAQLGKLLGTDQRNGALQIGVEDMELEAGGLYSIDFHNRAALDLLGLQFTLAYDQEALELVNIEEKGLLKADNFGQQLLEKGALTASWSHADPISLNARQQLFRLQFRARQSGQLSDLVQLNSQYTPAEAYRADAALLDVQFDFEDASGLPVRKFALYQNQPNPFRAETLISFWLPESGEASLQVYDISGKLVWRRKDHFERGYHEQPLNKAELGSTGIFYYQLKTDNHTAVKKMTLIR